MSKTWDKSKLPSRHVTEGPARAPHRSYYYAMGLSTKDSRAAEVETESASDTSLRKTILLPRHGHGDIVSDPPPLSAAVNCTTAR